MLKTARLSPLYLFLTALGSLGVSSGLAQQVQYSSAHRDGEHTLPQAVNPSGAAKLQAKLAGSRTGVSLIVSDFDADGTRDLVTGYAAGSGGVLLLQRGSPLATSPTPTEWSMLARGELVAPFAAKAEPLDVPVRPDLLQTADVHGFGHADLIVAAKGDTSLYLLFGHGDGTFAAPVAVPLAGAIRSLATWTGPGGQNLVLAGVCGSSGCGVQFFDREGRSKAFVRAPGAVTSIQTGFIDGNARQDIAFLAGGTPMVLDGETALSKSPVVETLPAVHGAALAVGYFVADRRGLQQIAVLGSDATLHVLTRAGIDNTAGTSAERAAAQKARYELALQGKRPAPAPLVKRTGMAWAEAETLSNIGPGGDDVLFLRAHLNAGGNDDLAAIKGTEYVTVAHTIERDGTSLKTTPIVTIDSTSAPVNAVAATRVSADARSGIVTLSSRPQPLSISVPTAYRTMTVNTTTDATPTAVSLNACILSAAGCTLRAAITQGNKDRASTGVAKVDTINIPAGTYTISASNIGTGGTPQNPDFLGSVNYHYEVDASMNLVGAGCTTSGTPLVPTSCTTIINGNNIDQVFSVDFGSFYATSTGDFESAVQDTFFSGMTIENGKNPNTFASSACEATGGSCNPYGGDVYWEVEGASNLVLTNVLIIAGTTAPASSGSDGGGGISASFDTTSSGTPGPMDIENSSIKSNASPGGPGGGVEIYYNVPLTLISDLITGNTSAVAGGGVDVFEDGSPYLTTITNSTISSNSTAGSSSGLGGGLEIQGALAMSGTTVTGNTGLYYGGGLYLSNPPTSSGTTLPATITASTFTANSLSGTISGVTYPQDGGGICIFGSSTNNTDTVTVQYSRFHGNTVTSNTAVTGLAVGCNSTINSSNTVYATVNAANNWWGCNGAATGTGCDTAHAGNVTSATLTLSPYTTLTLGLNTTTPVYGASVVATASLGQNSSGTIYTSANDTAYLATPITTFTLTDTGTVSYNPSATAFSSTAATGTSYAAATATGTANTTGTGTASLTVDGQSLTRTYAITAPDLIVTSAHTGNFKAGDTADTYTLTVGNTGTASTSGTVTVFDTLPSGFTATAMSGSGWTCTVSTLSCTSSSVVAASVTFPAITLTVSVASTDAGTYTNNVAVSGGGEANTNNDTGTDATIVVGTPTIAEAFNPASVAPNVASAVTFTLGNPSANSVSLTGVGFTDTLPTGLYIYTTSGAATTCTSGTVTAAANGSSIVLTGATIAAGATCTVTVNVVSHSIGSYTNTTGAVTATNSNAGSTASATLTVAVTPTKLVYTSVPPTPITAGGNAGTISVALEDASGNVATNNSSTSVALTVTGPSGYSQTYTATTTNGVASINLSSVPLTVAGTYTYTATATGLTQAQATEVVNPGAAAFLTVTGLTTFTAPQMAGTATVKALDSYGNTATGFTGTVTLSSTDSTATFSPASYTYTASDLGTHAFTVTFNAAGRFSVTATSGTVTGSEVNILVEDSILILNSNGTLARTTDAGAQTTAIGSANSTAATFGAVAFDNAGDIWTATNGRNSVQEFTKAGVSVTVAGSSAAGVTAPVSLFLDGLGQVWVANTNNSVSVLSAAGAAVSPSTGYTGGTTSGLNTPSGILVDSAGSVWITNRTGNSVTKIFGAAAPAVTPTVTGTTNNTLGTRP